MLIYDSALNFFFSVIAGSDPVSFFEKSGEIGKIVVAAFLGYFQNVTVGGQEKSCCHGETVLVQIIDKGGPHFLLEEFHEMGRREAGHFGDLIDGDLLLVVRLDIF